jgi:hypothetical protein
VRSGHVRDAPGWRVEHAWAELNGLCYDWQTHGRTQGGRSRFRITGTTPPGIPRDEYYASRRAEPRATFTAYQVALAVTRSDYAWCAWEAVADAQEMHKPEADEPQS